MSDEVKCSKCHRSMEEGWLLIWNPIALLNFVNWQPVKPGYMRLRRPEGSEKVIIPRAGAGGALELVSADHARASLSHTRRTILTNQGRLRQGNPHAKTAVANVSPRPGRQEVILCAAGWNPVDATEARWAERFRPFRWSSGADAGASTGSTVLAGRHVSTALIEGAATLWRTGSWPWSWSAATRSEGVRRLYWRWARS